MELASGDTVSHAIVYRWFCYLRQYDVNWNLHQVIQLVMLLSYKPCRLTVQMLSYDDAGKTSDLCYKSFFNHRHVSYSDLLLDSSGSLSPHSLHAMPPKRGQGGTSTYVHSVHSYVY